MTRRLKLPPQIIRLLVTTLVIVATYLIARYFLTPPTFGQYGWYRGEALREATAWAPVFAGKKACEECHAEVTQKVAAAEHKALSCETCHGASRAHAENPDVPVAKLTYSHCVRCHETDPSRPAWHKQIRAKEHYTGQRCTECHVPHQPNQVP